MKKRCKVLFRDGSKQFVDADDWQHIEDQVHCYRNGQSVAAFNNDAVQGIIVEEYDPKAWSKFARRMYLPTTYGTNLED